MIAVKVCGKKVYLYVNMEFKSKYCLFTWRDSAFSVHIHSNKCILRWIPIEVETNEHSPSPVDELMDCDVSCSSTSISLMDGKYFHFLQVDFSFDSKQLGSIPVLLVMGVKPEKLKGKSSSKDKSANKANTLCLLLGVRQKSSNMFNHVYSCPEYELVTLQKVYHRHESNDIPKLLSDSHIRIAAFHSVIILSPLSTSLSLCCNGKVATKVLDNVLGRDMNSRLCNLEIIDLFSNPKIHEIVLFLRYGHSADTGDQQCLCVSVLHKNCDDKVTRTDSVPSNLHVETISQDSIFSADFSQILLAMKCTSFTRDRSYLSKGQTTECVSCSLVMVTSTGYALRFINGSMSSCVYLLDHLSKVSGSDLTTNDQWKTATYKFVHMANAEEEWTAVQINSYCLLVDWENEKVTRTWHNVENISSNRKRETNQLCLVLFLNPAGERSNSKDLYYPLEQRDNFLVVNCFANLDVEDSTKRSEYALQRQSSDEAQSSKDINPPQCVVDVLCAQKKRYETAVKDAKAELTAKQEFLAETWENLEKLLLHDTEEETVARSKHTQRLIPLCAEPTAPKSDDLLSIAGMYQSYTRENKTLLNTKTKMQESSLLRKRSQSRDEAYGGKHLEVVGKSWQRTCGTLLIVGLKVQNIASCSVKNAYIQLIPMDLVSNNMLECVSSFGESPDQQKHRFGQSSRGVGLKDYTNIIEKGKDRALLAYVDTAKILSPGDIILHLTLNYSLNDNALPTGSNSLPRSQNDDLCKTYQLNSGCVIFSSNDQLQGTLSLEKILGSLKADGITTAAHCDVQALDCVQNPTYLVVRSKVSSVRCLETKLVAHPEMWALHDLVPCTQFIYLADHELKLCRVGLQRQVNKREGRLVVYARTDHQALLMVKLLKSFLPEDVTFHPEVTCSSQSLLHISETLQQHITKKMETIRSQLENLSDDVNTTSRVVHVDVEGGGDNKMVDDITVSPKFHSKLVSREKCVKAVGGHASSSNLNVAQTDTNKDEEGVLNKRQKISLSRKRLREKFGETGD